MSESSSHLFKWFDQKANSFKREASAFMNGLLNQCSISVALRCATVLLWSLFGNKKKCKANQMEQKWSTLTILCLNCRALNIYYSFELLHKINVKFAIVLVFKGGKLTLLCCLTIVIGNSLNSLYIYIYISSLCSYINLFWFLNNILSYRPAAQASPGTMCKATFNRFFSVLELFYNLLFELIGLLDPCLKCLQETVVDANQVVKWQISIIKYYSSKSKSTAFSILLEWKYKSPWFLM